MESRYSKKELREEALKLREGISASRRLEAELSANQLIFNNGLILSYSAIKSELSLNELNKKLSAEKRLVLPKVVKGYLQFYLVTNIEKELVKSTMGILEPNPDQCREIFPFDVSTLLIPGLLFDDHKTRLGYGMGHFDRSLPKFNPNAEFIGVGFNEQLYIGRLPKEEHDTALDSLLLF